jgi:hypothetical protein
MKSSKWTVKQIWLQSEALFKPKPYCDVPLEKIMLLKSAWLLEIT